MGNIMNNINALPIDCLLVALNEHMFGHNAHGPEPITKFDKLQARGLGAHMGPGSGELEFRAGGQPGGIFI